MDKMILLDAGHGGISQGQYLTPGKRYYDKTVQLAEGALNRAVVAGLVHQLHCLDVPCHWINPEHEDTPLYVRRLRVQSFMKKYDCFLLSVHHNAAGTANRAHGAEFFTSLADTTADNMAEYIGYQFTLAFPDRKLRRFYAHEYSKDANFTIIRDTCPAVLSEWGFMDSDIDRPLISSAKGISEQVNFFTQCLTYIHDDMM